MRLPLADFNVGGESRARLQQGEGCGYAQVFYSEEAKRYFLLNGWSHSKQFLTWIKCKHILTPAYAGLARVGPPRLACFFLNRPLAQNGAPRFHFDCGVGKPHFFKQCSTPLLASFTISDTCKVAILWDWLPIYIYISDLSY